MDRGIFRHMLTALAVLAIGPIAGAIAGDVRLPGGANGATALTSESPARGALLLLIALAITGATGTLAARLYGARQGLLCAGLVGAWVAWRQGTVEGVLINARSGKPLTMLAIEGLLVGAVTVAMVWLVMGAAAARDGAEGRSSTSRRASVAREGGGTTERFAAIGFSAALGAAGATLGAYLFGVEALKGQMVFAAFIGSVCAGAAAQFVRADAEHERRGGIGLGAFVGIACVAALAPVWAMWSQGSMVAEAAFAGNLARVANVGPVDWLAGALLGVPVGAAWASAMIQPARAHAEG